MSFLKQITVTLYSYQTKQIPLIISFKKLSLLLATWPTRLTVIQIFLQIFHLELNVTLTQLLRNKPLKSKPCFNNSKVPSCFPLITYVILTVIAIIVATKALPALPAPIIIIIISMNLLLIIIMIILPERPQNDQQRTFMIITVSSHVRSHANY